MEAQLNDPMSQRNRVPAAGAMRIDDVENMLSADQLLSSVKFKANSAQRSSDREEATLEREMLLHAQKDAFAAAMMDRPLAESLRPLVDVALRHFKGEARAAFYRGDTAGTMFTHIIGMTESYAKAVEGFKIGADSLACGLAIHRGEAMITPDVMCDARWEPFRTMAAEHNYRGCWSLPVRTTDGPVLGTLAFYFEQPRDATAVDLELAAILTHAATMIISRHQEASKRAQITWALEANERRLADELAGMQRLHELSLTLIQQPNLEQVMRVVMTAAAELLGAERCAAQLKDPVGDCLRLVASTGFDDDFVQRFSQVSRSGMTTCAAAFNRGQQVLVEDLGNSQEFSELNALATPMGIRAVMSTPLLSGDDVVGMFTLYWHRRQVPTTAQLRWIDLYVQQAARQVERRRAEQAKDNFLAQLSHELRTPLTPVLMAAAALKEDLNLAEDVRQQLGMIERNVALEARLIDDLLDLTRLSRGKLTLRKENCDLHAVLGLVLEMVRDEAREKQIGIALDLNARLPVVDGDPARLQQVFWNLLRNAVKFTPPGGSIHVTSRIQAGLPGSGRNGIRVIVQDNGIGFSPDAAERIFEPFEQGMVADDPRFPGLGLGLSITRSLVELHGGSIRAESGGPGNGAIFTVEFEQVDGCATSRNTPAAESSLEPEPPQRLLLVEDHAATLDVLARLLRRSGHTVTTASSVAGARAAADRQPFDAVISDLGLPDGTGFELMEYLRRHHGLVGIALSGYGAESDTHRSREAGFHAHLTKPANANDIRRVLRQMAAKAEATN